MGSAGCSYLVGIQTINMETINKSRTLSPIQNDDKSLKRGFLNLYSRTQQLLLLSNIFTVISYVLLILVVGRLYSCFEGKQLYAMLISLGILHSLFLSLLYFAWKCSIDGKVIIKTNASELSHHLNRILAEHKRRCYYLITCTILLVAGAYILLQDVSNGLTLILKVSMPFGVAVFLIGIYFMIKFKDQSTVLKLLTEMS